MPKKPLYAKLEVTPPGAPKVTAGNELERLTVKLNRGANLSTCSITIRNPNGAHTSTYRVDAEVDVYIDFNDPPTTKVFSGIIEKREITRFRGAYEESIIQAECTDHSVKLLDKLINRHYRSTEISEIIKDVLAEFPEFDTTGVKATSTPAIDYRVAYQTVRDICLTLAKLPREGEYTFRITPDKKVQFYLAGTEDTGYIFTSSEIEEIRFADDALRVKNKYYVRGGAEQTIDQKEEDTSTAYSLDAYYYARSFVPNQGDLSQIELYIKKIGSPDYDFTGAIVEDSAGEPTGWTVRNFSVSKEQIPSEGGWVSIWINKYLYTGDTYWIVVDKTGDASNTYEVYGPATGTFARSSDGLIWDTTVTGNLAYRTYYEKVVITYAEDPTAVRVREGLHVDPLLLSEAEARLKAESLLREYSEPYTQLAMTCYPPITISLEPGQSVWVDDPDSGIEIARYDIESIEYRINPRLNAYTYNLTLVKSKPPETIEDILKKMEDRLWETKIADLGLDEHELIDVPFIFPLESITLTDILMRQIPFEFFETASFLDAITRTVQASGTFVVGTAKVGYADVA